MAFSRFISFACLFSTFLVAQSAEEDESCRERLDRLETTVQRMLEMRSSQPNIAEMPVKKRSDDLVVETLSSKVAQLEAQVTALQTQVRSDQGSVYIRWGHTTCASPTETVYRGFMGGSLYTDTGSGANLLCLPENPVYDDLERTSCGPSTIYGAEYEVCPEPHHNMDIVCAVCRSPRPSTMMVPGTNTCPSGWTMEYEGHMMSAHRLHKASTEFVCVDRDPHDRLGSQANDDGALLYYTISKCGSLPCPPYVDDKILTCVVCSK